jgi:hypothetical protein
VHSCNIRAEPRARVHEERIAIFYYLLISTLQIVR